MAEVFIKRSGFVSPKSPLPCSSCGPDPPRAPPLLCPFAAVEVWNQAFIGSVTPSAACEAASNCEQHPAGVLGSNWDWDRSRVLCPQTRICTPCWLGLEVIPKAGFGIALFISLVVFSLKTSLWHFVESQNDLSLRDLKAPSIAPAMAGTHSSGPGIGIATIIP